MAEMGDLIRMVQEFRDKRNWKQFHNPKDLAISLTLEATEVLEHFQWKSKEEMETYVKSHKAEIGEELADVLYWVFLMGSDLDIDLSQAFIEKLKKNDAKYPVDKASGNHKKYTELQ